MPPEPTARGFPKVRVPRVADCENKFVDDAVVEKKLVVVPAVKERVPSVERPGTLKVPKVPDCEKRLVELAVVENKFVVVAFPRETFPEDVRFPAESVVPSYVRLALDVTTPAVVKYGILFTANPESVRLEVEAVPK